MAVVVVPGTPENGLRRPPALAFGNSLATPHYARSFRSCSVHGSFGGWGRAPERSAATGARGNAPA